MATIAGYHLNDEPDCFASGRPCRGEALTRNIRQVMDDIKPQVSTVDIVYCDLNGEYRRFREWSFADIRCFPRQSPRLVHPGDCFGDIGAAWVPVLAGIVSEGFERDMGKTAMIVCSDDYGKRGVMVLQKTETSKMVYSTRG
jgi:3-oxoacyl-[acyl-carrier-protein] synthase-1